MSSTTSVSHGEEACFRCGTRTNRGFRCCDWHAACAECVAAGTVSCQVCGHVAGQEEIRTDTDLRSNSIVHEATSTSSGNAPNVEGGMTRSNGQVAAATSANYLLSTSSRADLLDFLKSMQTILENCIEVERTSKPATEQQAPQSGDMSSDDSLAFPGNASSGYTTSLSSSIDASWDASDLQHGKSPVAALNEKLQELAGAPPGTQFMTWEFEPQSNAGFIASLSINLLGCETMQVRGSVVASSKKGAQHQAVMAALPLLMSMSETMSNGSGRSSTHELPELQEAFQKIFRKAPDWGEMEEHAENKQKYRVSIRLPDGIVVNGEWSQGKHGAKRAALKCVLDKTTSVKSTSFTSPASLMETVSAVPTQVVAPPQDSAASSSEIAISDPRGLPELQTAFQQLFKRSPAWGNIEEHSEIKQMFRVSVQLPSGNVVQGDWGQGKHGAKRAALERALLQTASAKKTSATLPAATATQFGSDVQVGTVFTGAATAGTHDLPELQEAFQKRFKASPNWGEVEQDAGCSQRFRVSIQLPSGEVIQGEWGQGKQGAKRAALEHVLATAAIA